VLLRQAALSFAMWTGRQPPIDAMRAALDAELGIASHA
jgi:shikimate 5-dehydrogenase